MSRGVIGIEILGVTVATPIVALGLALGLYGMAWYGKHSGWAAQRTRTPQAHVGHVHAPVAPFALAR